MPSRHGWRHDPHLRQPPWFLNHSLLPVSWSADGSGSLGMTALVEDLKQRHAKACDLKQTVDREAIAVAVQKWIEAIGAPKATQIAFISSADEMLKIGRDAKDARDARAAR